MNEGTYPGGRTVDATNEIKRVSVPALDNILGQSAGQQRATGGAAGTAGAVSHQHAARRG